MGFHRQEYWIGLVVPSPGDLLDPGIEPTSPLLTGAVIYLLSEDEHLGYMSDYNKATLNVYNIFFFLWPYTFPILVKHQRWNLYCFMVSISLTV